MKDTRFVSLLAVSALLAASLAGCGSSASSVASSASSEAVSSVAESAVSEAASESAAASSARALEDGTYTAFVGNQGSGRKPLELGELIMRADQKEHWDNVLTVGSNNQARNSRILKVTVVD